MKSSTSELMKWQEATGKAGSIKLSFSSLSSAPPKAAYLLQAQKSGFYVFILPRAS